ncbi:MAG TPA: class II aldolase/adducin family protein [Chloroflexota bacterium]|nr:class II aldolase/adducin family protein [Chloroflexota bacterium]
MSSLAQAREDLVAANRILAHEGILDAYGHVSVRHPDHPDRYILSRARSPELVEDADLYEFSLDGTPLQEMASPAYIERYIHGAVYEARPEVMAVCHNHLISILPFSISTGTRLRPVIHSARALARGEVPVWDIADESGTATDLLVRNMIQGRSLARRLGDGMVALMRGHGSVVAGRDAQQVVQTCVGMDKNARVQLQALQLGGLIPLHDGECDQSGRALSNDNRAWEYWKRRAGL